MRSRLAASCRRTAAGASAASRNMRVAAAARSLTGRRELGDEVVGVATEIALAELDGAAVAVEADALDQQARVALAGVEAPRLLGVQQQRAQALQRAHRAVAAALERLVEGDADGIERGKGEARHGGVFEAHRRVVGV